MRFFRYASAFFLYKIYQLRKTDNDVPIIRNGESDRFLLLSEALIWPLAGSFLSYMHSLFLIALGNFIFPSVTLFLKVFDRISTTSPLES